MEYPNIVNAAVLRMQRGESIYSACAWLWDMGRSDDRLSVDDWIVATKHPLGEMPSTREHRFRLLVEEVFVRQAA